MKVKISLLNVLRELLGEEFEFKIEGEITLKEFIEKLCEKDERIREYFFINGEFRGDILILKNGTSINFLNGMETKLRDEDELIILPASAGG